MKLKTVTMVTREIARNILNMCKFNLKSKKRKKVFRKMALANGIRGKKVQEKDIW